MRRSLSLMILLLLLGATAQASPITYVLSGSGSGSVDGTAFTDQSFTFTFFGDTDNVVGPAPFFQNFTQTAPATLQINGFATATLPAGVLVFDFNNNGVLGIERCYACLDIFDLQASAFLTYDLRTALGPISATSFISNSQGAFSTSLGDVEFTSYSTSTSFEARTAAAPEPSTLALLGAGLAVVVQRRFKQRT